MRNHSARSADGHWKPPRWTWLPLAVLGLGIALTYWPRRAVELDQRGYDTAIALYRVCNQRSREGLRDIERILGEQPRPDAGDSPQSQALHSIIDTTEDARWEEAARSCRMLIAAQVER